MILNVIIFIMNETECDVKNYADIGKCQPLRPKVEVDNSLQDLHDYSHHTKDKLNNHIVLLFIKKIYFYVLSKTID